MEKSSILLKKRLKDIGKGSRPLFQKKTGLFFCCAGKISLSKKRGDNNLDYAKKKTHKLRLPVRSSLSFFAFLSLGRASTFLTTPIFTRLLTPEEYALTPLYYTWLSVFSTLATLDLTGSILLSGLSRHKKEADRYLSSATSLTLTTALVTFFVVLLLRGKMAVLTGLPVHLLLLMFLQILSGIVIASVECRAKFFYQPKRAIPSILASAFLSPIIAYLLIRSGVLRAEGRILATVISTTLVAIPSLIFLYRRGRCFFNKHIWKEQLLRALPLFPHYLALMTLAEVGRIFVGRLDTPDALAKLGVAATLSHAIPLLAAGINSAFYPWLLRRIRSRESGRVREVTTIVVKIISFAAICLILLSPEFYSILAPKEGYGDGLYATAPLVISSLFAFLYTIVAGVNLECAKPSRIAITTLLCALLGVALTLPMVLKFGFIGASIATALSYIFLTALHSLLLLRTSGRNILPLAPRPTILLTLALGISAILTLYLKAYLPLRLLLLFVPLLLLLDLALRSRSLFHEVE